MNGNDFELVQGVVYNDVIVGSFPSFFDDIKEDVVEVPEDIKEEKTVIETLEVIEEINSVDLNSLIPEVEYTKPVKVKKEKVIVEVVPEYEDKKEELLIEDSSEVTVEVSE
jgi:hypothetical protein